MNERTSIEDKLKSEKSSIQKSSNEEGPPESLEIALAKAEGVISRILKDLSCCSDILNQMWPMKNKHSHDD